MDKQTVVHPDNGMLFRSKKKWAMQGTERHRGTVNIYYFVKEANLKMLQRGIWFQWYDIVEKQYMET